MPPAPATSSPPMGSLYEVALATMREKIEARFGSAVDSGMEDPVIELTTTFEGVQLKFSILARTRHDMSLALYDPMTRQPSIAATQLYDLSSQPYRRVITIMFRTPSGFMIKHEPANNL